MKFNYSKLIIINYFYILILELLFKILVIGTIDTGIFFILWFTLPIAVLLTLLMSLFKKKIINQIISYIIWFLVLAIFIAETLYYSFYKTICGVGAIVYGSQVLEFSSAIGEHVKQCFGLLIIMLMLFVILIILSIKKISYQKFSLKITLALLVASIFVNFTTMEYHFKDGESTKNLYFKLNDLMQSTNRFGLLHSLVLNGVKELGHFEESVVPPETLPFTKDKEKEYNTDNLNFTDIENDAMDQYFSSAPATNKNAYTGLFAGKNLIFIVAEGFSPIAVDAEITPTLYQLVNNSLVFNNYYQPLFNCSTSDGEFISLLSLLPGVSTCSMKATIDKYFPYALGNIMQQYDYKTYAFHGWTYTYYNRDKTLPNLGFTYYGYDRYKTGYKYALKGIKDAWPTSDIDVVNASYPTYHKETPFVAYYMSISGHLAYNFKGGNAMALKNRSVVQNIKAKESVKAYIATQVEFDRSLKLLMEKLENDGILDDTVIVVTADHYPYGLSQDDIASYVDWLKNPTFDLYKNNLIIYNSQMPKTIVDKYTSSLDILPTLLNLFGVKYDSRLLMGSDIFSESEDLVIFNDKSWITSKGRYDYLKKKFEPFGSEVSSEYIDEINAKVKLKFQMSKLLITKDYYRKVLGE